MKKIVAIHAGPRPHWNTASLVSEAAAGARSAGAEVEAFELYRLEKFTGCISCFGCKQEPNKGKCILSDGLAPVLQAIRDADGLIIGSPNYLGDLTAGFRALFERLVFQSLTYNRKRPCCNSRPIPVLLIVTSNAPESAYAADQPYGQMLARYRATIGQTVGPVETFVCGDTLQVKDYSRYDWTIFDPAAKKARHDAAFPAARKEAFSRGAGLLNR